MSEIELKNCPFCGSKAEVYTRTAHVPQLNNPKGLLDAMWIVDCTECDCNIELNSSRKKAIALWNTRPIEDQLKVKLELRQAAYDMDNRLGKENEQLQTHLNLAVSALNQLERILTYDDNYNGTEC